MEEFVLSPLGGMETRASNFMKPFFIIVLSPLGGMETSSSSLLSLSSLSVLSPLGGMETAVFIQLEGELEVFVLSPPCGIANGTTIFANAPYGAENSESKEKGLNF